MPSAQFGPGGADPATTSKPSTPRADTPTTQFRLPGEEVVATTSQRSGLQHLRGMLEDEMSRERAEAVLETERGWPKEVREQLKKESDLTAPAADARDD